MSGTSHTRRLAVALGLLLSSAALGAAFPAVLRIPRRPQALVGFTHDEMREEKFCGRCHDGRGAFAIAGADCARCHVDGR